MPIKPENKEKYPANWKKISADIRFNRARNRCEVCGIKNYQVIYRMPGGLYRLPSLTDWDMIHSRIKNCHSNFTESLKYHGFTRVVLTVAHLDHNPENNDYRNLMAMCQKCHNNYDRNHRRQTIRNSQLRGQLSLAL